MSDDLVHLMWTDGGFYPEHWAGFLAGGKLINGRWTLSMDPTTEKLVLFFAARSSRPEAPALLQIDADEFVHAATAKWGFNTAVNFTLSSGAQGLFVGPRKRTRELFGHLGHPISKPSRQ